jgi:CRP-like cAMP-binding protein
MAKKRSRPSVRPPPRRSERPPPADGRPKNRLLASLPDEDFRRLLPHLKTVAVQLRHVFHKQGEPIRHVYFPNGGVCSVTAVLSSGESVEAATVGDEGMVGIEAFFTNSPVAPGETLMQVPDTNAERLSVEDFRRELAGRGALHDVVGRYAQAKLAEMIQTAACNALHQVQQRCARWLLMTHDRMHEQDFHLSHEFLAVMLGVQRPTVSVVAATLQQAGLIRYIHGRVTVTNRKGLEAAACECYSVVRAHFDRQQR